MNDRALQNQNLTTSTVAALPASMPSIAHGVSWPAVFAGATSAAALSLILVILGVGLGLSSVSPWVGQGASPDGIGLSTIVWLSFTQLAAAGMGGYLAGRLRTRWSGVHNDEVYFRDTAHGFLAWSLATLVTAGLLTSAIAGILGSGTQASATLVAGASTPAAAAAAGLAQAAVPDEPAAGQAYFVDSLFRRDASTPVAADMSPRGPQDIAMERSEVGRILASAMSLGSLAGDDLKYLGQMLSQRTGIPEADAQKRVGDVFARMQAKSKEAEAGARELAEKARRAAAYSALWLFVSLLSGAFIASLAATYGGRRRDRF